MAGEVIYERTERLVGPEVMQRLQSARVILFGIGGVGSWCAEALVRSGVTNLAIVDADRIGATNVNRQLMATSANIGASKVAEMKARLLSVNPAADIRAIEDVYTDETRERFALETYDYIIDAIDSLKDKLDPTQVRVAEFWEVRGCPLGAALRKRYRKQNTLPAKKFLCVYDPEVLPNLGPDPDPEADPGLFHKAQVNGTAAPVTGIFGLTLAGLVLQDIYRKTLHKLRNSISASCRASSSPSSSASSAGCFSRRDSCAALRPSTAFSPTCSASSSRSSSSGW